MVFNPSAGADFPSNDMLTVFPIQMHGQHVDLAINWVKVITGS